MSPRIIVTVTEDGRAGKEYLFSDRTLCTVGRSRDCILQLPSDEAHSMISRRHCLLEIDPPAVRVRDLGSLNGTFVNGKQIGGRGKQLEPEGAALVGWPERELHDGDEVRIGNTVLRIGVFIPVSAICPVSAPASAANPHECELFC